MPHKDPEARKAYHKAYYEKNKAEWPSSTEWARANPKKAKESKAAWKTRNKERVTAYNKAWARSNAGKVTAYARAYQLLKLKRIPKWLSENDREAISRFYVNRPAGYHVDHIIPLKGKEVSGLHVPWNLQYLSATENVRKSNKLKP